MNSIYSEINNNEFYKSLFEKYNSVILIIDVEKGNIIECNDFALDFYGYSKEELLSLTIFDLNQLPNSKVKDLMKKAKNKNKKIFNFYHRTKYNEIKNVVVRSIPMKLEEGTILFSIIRDSKDLDLQKKYINKFIEKTSYAVAILDDKARYERINNKFEELFGYREEEVINQTPEKLIHSSKTDFKVLNSTLSKVGFLQDDVIRVNKSNEKLNVEMTVFYIYYKNCIRKIVTIYKDIREKYKLMEKLEYKAKYDSLTKVFNRGYGINLLEKYWDIYLEQESEFCILFIDINKMKVANDKFGHIFGDKVIKKVIEILKLNIRNADVISRFGGDEFLVILPGMKKEDLDLLIKKIKEDFKENKYSLSDKYGISVSIGYAINTENDIKNSNAFISKADERMYIEKQKNKC